MAQPLTVMKDLFVKASKPLEVPADSMLPSRHTTLPVEPVNMEVKDEEDAEGATEIEEDEKVA